MAVVNDFECMAHGHFEARVSPGTIPKCPKGCNKALVKLIHINAPRIGNQRYKRGDKLLREAADLQGLSDISTSPSRPGGSVAQRNRLRNRNRMLGPKGREYPEAMRAQAVDLPKYIGALTNKENALTRMGYGHGYNADEWKKDEKTDRIRHVGAQGPITSVPLGSTGVSIERVKEKP